MLEKLTQIFSEYKEDDTLSISRETTFEELELDSLDTVELIMIIEEEFSVTIEMDTAVKSVGDLMRVMEEAGAKADA